MKPFTRAIVATVFAAPLALFGGMVAAQWTGASDAAAPSSGASRYATTTVAEIKASPQDDMKVVLTGTIVRKLGHEKYLFTDGTGQIEVEIDDEDFPNVPVNDKTRLQIEGEVDTHRARDADIDADRVVVVK